MLIQSLKRRRANHLGELSEKHDKGLQLITSTSKERKVKTFIEDTEFYTLSQYKNVGIYWNEMSGIFESHTNRKNCPIHGYLNFETLSKTISNYFVSAQELSWDTYQTDCVFSLDHGISVRSDYHSGLEPFIMFSTQSYIPDRGNDNVAYYLFHVHPFIHLI